MRGQMKDYVLNLEDAKGPDSSVLYATFPGDARALEFARHKLDQPPHPRAIAVRLDGFLIGRVEAPTPTAV